MPFGHSVAAVSERPDPPIRVSVTGRGLPPQRNPLSPSAMAETTLSKKMRAFDGEVAIAIAQLYLVHMLQRTLPAGFIAPCLPTKTDKLPSGRDWLHEIKHDGFRIIARKKGAAVIIRLRLKPEQHISPAFTPDSDS